MIRLLVAASLMASILVVLWSYIALPALIGPPPSHILLEPILVSAVTM